MRWRAQALEKNNEIVGPMLDRSVENLLGDGFGLQSTTPDAVWNAKAQNLFWDWADSADIQGKSFYRWCALFLRSHLRDGDIGVALLTDGRLQAIEADLIQTNYKDSSKTIRVIDGVEMNDQRRPVGYWVQTLKNGKVDFSRFDAQDFILFSNEKRFGEARGMPYLQCSFNILDHIVDWMRSSVIAAKIAACFGLIITKTNAQQTVNKFNKVSDGCSSKPIQDIEPGMTAYLNPGEDIKTLSPAQPQQSFPDQLRIMLRLVGLSLGLPLEQILLDYSEANFSSARMSMIQTKRTHRAIQERFMEVLSRIYKWRISKFIKDGQLEARPDAWSHRWKPAKFEYADPVKELQARMLEMDMGLTDLETLHIEAGTDYKEWLERRATQIKDFAGKGIPLLRSNMSAQIIGTPTPQDVQNQNLQDAVASVQGGPNENQ